MAIERVNQNGTGQYDAGLTPVQRRFLGKCRRDPKPLADMLHECRVGFDTFSRWRADPRFARAFRRATAGMTRDTLTDLRFTFAMCGRIISAQVAQIQKGQTADLNPAVSRLCFDAIKVGIGAFVPKPGKRRPFPRIDPALFARLQRAQQGDGNKD